jgi:cysteine desulfuration protein SufE
MTSTDTIRKLVDEFAAIPDWEDRYAHIIALGRALPEYPEEHRMDKYKVSGCQSQVWLFAGEQGRAEAGAQGTVDGGTHGHKDDGSEVIHFEADSDAAIVKGLIAILMKIYNDRTPQEILGVSPDFIQQLGLDQHLTVNRTNGLASMMKQIHLYAIAYGRIDEERKRARELHRQ